jgi:hypothetical protein
MLKMVAARAVSGWWTARDRAHGLVRLRRTRRRDGNSSICLRRNFEQFWRSTRGPTLNSHYSRLSQKRGLASQYRPGAMPDRIGWIQSRPRRTPCCRRSSCRSWRLAEMQQLSQGPALKCWTCSLSPRRWRRGQSRARQPPESSSWRAACWMNECGMPVSGSGQAPDGTRIGIG